MRRFLFVVILVAFLVGGGWLLYHRDQIKGPGDFLRVAGQQISSLGGGARPQNIPWQERPANLVRIGTFNIDGLSAAKIAHYHRSSILAHTIRQFDVVALQEVDVSDQFALKRFINLLNSEGRQFQMVLGTASGKSDPRTGGKLQLAFFYDASTLELVQGQYYHVSDPDNVLVNKPLVGWFRTKPTSVEHAFTFTLVNIDFDIESKTNEASQIAQIFRAIRGDGRQEDDVILAGDFGLAAIQLNQAAVAQGLLAVNTDFPTSAQTTDQWDNMMLDPLATGEFTGNAGVYDLMKLHNLTLRDTLFVSDHLPVWAEFSVYENGAAAQVATLENQSSQK